MAAVDYFLKIDGISGESTDSKHKGEIEVESFSWGVSNAARAVTGGGAGAGRARFNDFAFTTRVNKASPTLFMKCASGQHIKQAVLIARKAGEQPVEFLKITLSDVLISSYQTTGAADAPNDSSALHYGTSQFVEGPQQHIAVSSSAAGALSYDPKTNSFVQSDLVNGVMTVGSVGGVISRGVEEFDVGNLIGLLTAPFGTAKLRLLVTEVREAATNPGAAIAAVDAFRPGRQKPGRFDVILYTPADLTLTTDDLTRKGTRIGTLTVDPNADPASLTIDLTQLEQRRHLGTFGIRLQLHGAPIPKLHEDGDDENDPDVEQPTRADSADDGRAGTPVSTASFTLALVFDSA